MKIICKPEYPDIIKMIIRGKYYCPLHIEKNTDGTYSILYLYIVKQYNYIKIFLFAFTCKNDYIIKISDGLLCKIVDAGKKINRKLYRYLIPKQEKNGLFKNAVDVIYEEFPIFKKHKIEDLLK